MNWNFQIGSLTPKKTREHQGSTGCNKDSRALKPYKDMQQLNNIHPFRPLTRFGKEILHFQEQEVQKSRRTLKMYKIDDPPFFSEADILPFSLPDDDEVLMEVEESKTENIKCVLKKQFFQIKPTLKKKHSICELEHSSNFPSLPPLYRTNSTLVIHNEKEVFEFLGDNTFVKQLQHESLNNQDSITKYELLESSRLATDYYLLENLGKTQMHEGNAMKCLSKLDRMVYVIKEYSTISSTSQPEFSIFRTIMRTSIKDKTNCLVKFFFSWIQNNNLYLVYQPATYTIKSLNNQRSRLSQDQIRLLLRNICKGLQHLNAMNMNHLNIKPSNIVNCRGKFKIMDFVASKHNFGLFRWQKTKYTAPELEYPVLVNSNDLWKADVFSLGMVIVENIVGPINHHIKQNEVKERVMLKKKLQSSHQYSPNIIKLLLEMTNNDSRFRPTLQEITGVKPLNIQHETKKTRKYSL